MVTADGEALKSQWGTTHQSHDMLTRCYWEDRERGFVRVNI